MTTDKNTLKSWFRKGLKPLEAHFAAWIDSYWHKAEQIPTSSIEGLEATLNNKAETAETQNIRENIADIADGTTPVEKARYAEKLGTADDHYAKTTLDSRLATFQTQTGDGQNITVTFSQADKRENIAAGENLYGLFGKIARWFSDLKAVAFSGNTSDLAETDGKLLLTQPERDKLAGIQTNANAYTHPYTHPATMIDETPGRLFVTPADKTKWNNKADLDGSGKVPASQLPPYVDDVLTHPALSAFPATGENGKIYITTDTNRQYRWSGSSYVEISASLALGETPSTAYRGDRGKTAYDYATTQRTIGEIQNLQAALDGKQAASGDGKNLTVTFTEAPSRQNIASGETLSALFGKIKKWFSNLGSLAFKNSVTMAEVDGLANELASKVGGNDPRLTDARKASDVYAWAKTASKPEYTFHEIGNAAQQSVAPGTTTRKILLNVTKNANGWASRAAIGLTNQAGIFSPLILSVGTNDAGTTWTDYTFATNGRLTSPAGTFALTSDIPAKLPANGGNADTVGGLGVASLMRKYTITVGGDTSHFYPCTWSASDMSVYMSIHSPSLTGTAPYNQNEITFLMSAFGWSDMPRKFMCLEHGLYENNEINIHSIYSGTMYGMNCIYLRGGSSYSVFSNTVLLPHGSSFTYVAEEFGVMDNDGTVHTANVARQWLYTEGRSWLGRTGDQAIQGNFTLSTTNSSYIDLARNGVSKGYMGLGSSGNTDIYISNRVNSLRISENGKNYSNDKEIATVDKIPTHFDNLYVPKAGGTYTGYVDFIAGAGNSGSDMRFKTDVEPLENILDDLLDLQIINYTWTKESETRRNTFGLSATQLTEKGQAFRKIVHERDDDNHTQWVEYDRIGVLALKGLQEITTELRNENKRLRQSLQTRQQNIDTLQQQMAALQQQMQTLANSKTQTHD